MRLCVDFDFHEADPSDPVSQDSVDVTGLLIDETPLSVRAQCDPEANDLIVGAIKRLREVEHRRVP